MHRERCLVYESGEMGPREAAEFSAHLGNCPDCREWLDLIARGRAWAQAAAQDAPEALVQAALSRAAAEPPSGDGGGGGGGPGWLKVILVTATLAGAGGALQWLSPPREVPSAQQGPRLEMPGPKDRTLPRPAQDSPLPLATPAESGPPMPARPLDCGSPQAILDFKAFVIHGSQDFPGQGRPSHAERWSACLCGARAGQAGMPPLPPREDSAWMLPACLAVPASPAGPKEKKRQDDHIISVAKDFYGLLPLDQKQAIRLAQCYCGPMPEEERP